MKTKGFTLIEILLVIVLIGLLSMVLVPKIFEKQVEKNEDEIQTFFNNIIKKATTVSDKKQLPVYIKFIKGSDKIILWDNTQKTIPNNLTLNRIEINGKTTPGLNAYVFIYPNNTMDYVNLFFSNGKKYYTQPVLAEIYLAKQ